MDNSWFPEHEEYGKILADSSSTTPFGVDTTFPSLRVLESHHSGFCMIAKAISSSFINLNIEKKFTDDAGIIFQDKNRMIGHGFSACDNFSGA